MTAILGISAFYHDSAAALVVDGEIVAAAQEERFTRKKHDADFPIKSIEFCLKQAGLKASDLDYVGFYEKPLRKFERIIETYTAYAPRGYWSFRRALPLWLKQKLHIPRELRRFLPDYTGRPVFIDHHQSHAAGAFFPSPFDEAVIVTLDGVGEWSTSCLGHGRGNRISLSHEQRFPHSLGLLYSAFTYYTGFRVNSGEYKLMGLAPYGKPIYRDLILEHLVDLKSDGSMRMEMSYFNYCQGLTMTSPKFHRLFGGPPRPTDSTPTQRERDLAASIQAVTEEAMLRTVRHAYRLHPSENLVLAGGVALNCVGNGRILREGPFENIWIQPAAGDAGGALGTALFIGHQLLNRPRETEAKVVLPEAELRKQPGDGQKSPALPGRSRVAASDAIPRTLASHGPALLDRQKGSFLGPAFSDEEIKNVLDKSSAVYHHLHDDEFFDRVASLIDEQEVVGWFQGRMEFGPRALGARSILGDARSPSMQSTMNLKIKFRESFRPFAPIVLREFAHQYFDLKPACESPYMMLVAFRSGQGCSIPAVTHVDGSARLQTVDADRNPRLYSLLCRFHERTHCPVMINTSFNVRGEPMVCTPDDAYRCFMATDMDALAIGNYLLHKGEQSLVNKQDLRDRHLRQFKPD